MTSRLISRLFTLALPLMAVLALVAWMLDMTGPRQSKLAFDTVAVSRGEVRRIVATSGPVRALVTVSIGSQLSGQIETVEVDFNSEVRQGDVLARLDARTFEARVAQGEADLKAAEAALANQQAALSRAEAILKNAERTITRQKSLAAKGFAAQATLDNATRDQEVARAEIAVARAQIASAEATIAQRKATLEQARIELERCVIRSPINGTVISRSVDPGQTVAASLQAPELFQIAQDLSRIRIEAQVNEADVGAVAEGNPVVFAVDAYPDREFEGRVTQVRLAATEINNVVTYTVIIEARNEERRLFPGMTANVRIESARRDGVLRVPNDVFRYRPRDVQTAAAQREENAQQRTERTVERIRTELELDETQGQRLREEVAAVVAEMRNGGGQPGFMPAAFDTSAFRQLLIARMDQSIAPSLSPEQRRLYERWKLGQDGTRTATVWRLNSEGRIERRIVRTGLADDAHTEIIGGQISEGDKIIVRVREAPQ